jgi:Cu2+-containing amine oxidase
VVVAKSFDPLSLNEISKVSSLALPQALNSSYSFSRDDLRSISGPRLRTASAPTNSANSSTAPKTEVLLIERHEEEKNAPKDLRRADVFTYDYSTNELISSLVDLNTQQVVSSSRKKGIQLPLTENEIKRAKDIVFSDEDERQILAYEYQRITSRIMTNTTELNIKAFTFTADSLPNRTNEASKLCGSHRCAQLMLYTGENIVFEISPIVNLSEGIVTQRIGF